MKRDQNLQEIEQQPRWDVIIIGGGATGLGTAVEAASRGYKTLLLEQHDFAKGTSGRSTKLVHGGVRYLRQGDMKLVREALRERGLMHQNAPHLVKNRSFVLPAYSWWEGPFYGLGLKIYDAMAGDLGLGSSTLLSVEETLKHIPTLETDGLDGGIKYHDAQFNDARMAITLLHTLGDEGGTALNYMKVTDLLKSENYITGVMARDQITDQKYTIKAKAVINATGIFTDQIRQMDDPSTPPVMQPSRGVHIVLDQSFQPGNSGILVPRTDDGRVIFAIPWKNRVLVGTTDIPIDQPTLEPRPTDKEIDYLLEYASKYLIGNPTRADVRSAFAGIRPLVATNPEGDTADISRDHTLIQDPSNLITITGGKWTTYRLMGEDAVDMAADAVNLDKRKSVTDELKLHGWTSDGSSNEPYAEYGTDAPILQEIENEVGDEPFHPELPILPAQVVYAVRHEMAFTLEDVLARRTRCLLLDANATLNIAKPVAQLMATELGENREWLDGQMDAFNKLAEGYLI